MIKNKTTSKDFIQKYNDRYASEDMIADIFSNITTYINSNVSSVNDINSNMLRALDLTAVGSSEILLNLNQLASKMADLYAISGATKQSLDPYVDNIKVLNQDGVMLDRNTQIIKLESGSISTIIPNSISVDIRNGQLGTSDPSSPFRYNDIDSVVSKSSFLAIESIGSKLMFSISMSLGQEYLINNLSFVLNDIGVMFPIISSIKAYTSDGSSKNIVLNASGSTSLDIESLYTKSNNVSIDFDETSCERLVINFVQNNSYKIGNLQRFAVELNSLRVGLLSSTKKGSVVIGPFSSKSQILKASLFADVYKYDLAKKNIVFQISHNLEDWTTIDNSGILNSTQSKNKIINYNNVDISSIRTQEPVKDLYLRISMDGINTSSFYRSESDIKRYSSLLSNSNKTLSAPGATSTNTSVIIHSGDKIGLPIVTKRGNDFTITKYTTSFSSDVAIPFSITDTDGLNVLIKTHLSNTNRMFINNRPEKVSVINGDKTVVVPSQDFDASAINIIQYTRPIINSSLNIAVGSNFTYKEKNKHTVLPLKGFVDEEDVIPCGEYVVIFNTGESIRIDCSDGFFYGTNVLNYIVDEDTVSCRVISETGVHIGTVLKEEGKNYISLYDLFVGSTPSIANKTFLKAYPCETVTENTFAIEDGKILFGTTFSGTAQNICTITESNIKSYPEIGPGLCRRQIVDTSKQIKYKGNLLTSASTKVVKLAHTNIIDGTLTFSTYNSPSNAFIKEVQFIDGHKEFIVNKYTEIVASSALITEDNLTPISISTEALDDIEFSGNIEYVNNRVYSEEELVYKGDYLITTNGIMIPDGINASLDHTFMRYSSDNTVEARGLYSVDYKKGIVYASSYFNNRTQVSYLYSFTFARYQAAQKLQAKEFAISGSVIQIKKEMHEDEKINYTAIVIKNADEAPTYVSSPYIKELKLNIITEENFL